MSKVHRVLIGPGMDGKTDKIKWLTRNWEKNHGLIPEMIPITWKDNEHFVEKLARITDTIDHHVGNGDIVDLVGCSASGSAMLNAFMERKKVVHKVVNIAGFLRPGKARWIRNFDTRSAASIAFRESVYRFTKVEPTLTIEDRKKILTVRPLFGDELVPGNTVMLQGAMNRTVPMIEHIASIAFTLVRFDPVIAFLKG